MNQPTHVYSAKQKQQLDDFLAVHYEGALDKTLHIIMRNAVYSSASLEEVEDNLASSIMSLQIVKCVLRDFQPTQ